MKELEVRQSHVSVLTLEFRLLRVIMDDLPQTRQEVRLEQSWT